MDVPKETLIEEARKAVADWDGDIFDESDYLRSYIAVLLIEMDRLTLLNFAHNDEEHDCGVAAERARILDGMEGLRYEYRGRIGKVKMWVEAVPMAALVRGE
jgi:hypothetical protein